jgi:hypothetical protein
MVTFTGEINSLDTWTPVRLRFGDPLGLLVEYRTGQAADWNARNYAQAAFHDANRRLNVL